MESRSIQIKCKKNKHSALLREARRRGEDFPSFDDWVKTQGTKGETALYEREPAYTNGGERLHSSPTTTTDATTATTTTKPTTETQYEKEPKINYRGSEKRGWGENFAPDPLEETFASVGDSGEFEENKRTAMLKLADYR